MPISFWMARQPGYKSNTSSHQVASPHAGAETAPFRQRQPAINIDVLVRHFPPWLEHHTVKTLNDTRRLSCQI
ncbi:hypothetical protein J4530_00275 [Neisseria subflava]|uniref:hypothetical protein n=1 Tax=Neisseria subflava TaxID=28449 RepID=UPI00202A0167|nr:hypothetical protein [Neisseria subflava]MCL9786723.1 hypothetical protein [Neisseria subflava]